MAYQVLPATAPLWPALERLFGRGGASNGCWCMYWLLGPEYHRRDRALNRQALRASVEQGPPPGLLAFAEGADPERDAAIGWLRLTPRAELAWLNAKREFAPVDEQPVWSVSCLYVGSRHRRSGVAGALVRAAVEQAAAGGAPAVEAYPVDASVPGATRNAFTGYLTTFLAAGFTEVARRAPARPIVRHPA
ncbi:GNAT family N-acetyltransferase [Gryllotalpicola ginsengisoli]|uniref:GNAT family N-acetyltransferase n=1 Tax=Gryllotalpicola ginsengisoli TaxID=444608 RepID=UPI0003B6A4EC|nr:GNAT family N-acetyltransferase [Gryllotalpicola ginsengisoli]